MKKFLSLAVVLMFTASVFANTTTGKKNNEKAKTHTTAQDKEKGKDKGKDKGTAKSKGETKGKGESKSTDSKPKK